MAARARTSRISVFSWILSVFLYAATLAAQSDILERQAVVPIHRADRTRGVRAIVLVEGEQDVALLRQLRRIGVNTIVTGSLSLETALAAEEAGMTYVGFISAADTARLVEEPEYLAEVSAVASIASFRGFHYLDTTTAEGYTSPDIQARTYSTLKELFPSRLVIFPFRLDLIELDPSFLDEDFRPEFTDLVTPYFYPVGTTMLGAYQYADDWETTWMDLLARLKRRIPAGKGVLPVLQAFEQSGYPVESGFAGRQVEVTGRIWPSNQNFALFAWGLPFSADNPFLTLDRLPALQTGFESTLSERSLSASPVIREPF